MLGELIAQARREKKWLYCHYQQLWFSPDQLEQENAAGKFRWGPENWTLRSPQERLDKANQAVAYAILERDRIEKEIS